MTSQHPWNAYRARILKFETQLEPKAIQLENISLALSKKRFDGVIVAGMGGSGLPGTFLESLASALRFPVPLILSKTYNIPVTPFRNPLVLCISFSGNTEETLSAFRATRQKKMNVAVVAGKGKLLALARSLKIPLATFPSQDLTAREAIGYTWTSVKRLLQVHFPSLKASNLSKVIHSGVFEREGKTLASALKGTIPLIYTDNAYAHAGYFWKIILNETSKLPAFAHTIPEMLHNEIAGFENSPRKLLPLFILDSKASAEIKKKTRIVQAVLTRHGFKTLKTTLRGKTPEEKTMNTIVLAHWTALYIAKFNHQNPEQTNIIEEIKRISKS